MVDKEDLATLLVLHFPAFRQRLAHVREHVQESDQLLIVLVLLVVNGRVGTNLLQDQVQAIVLLEEAARLSVQLD